MADLDKLKDLCDYFKIKPLEGLPLEVKLATKLHYIDKEGYKYYLSLENMKVTLRRNGAFARFFNKNPHTESNIKNFLLKEDKPFVLWDYNNCTGAREKITFKCNICGELFNITWNQVQHGVGCVKCSRIKMKEHAKTKRYSIGEVRNYLSKFNIQLIEKEYLGNNKKMRCLCNIHGEFFSDWINIRKSTHPCSKCVVLNKSQNIDRLTPLLKLKELIEDNGQYKIIGEYINCKTKIEILCLKCNHVFSIRPDHLRNGVGCPCSSPKSRGEQRIEEILTKHNISFVTQKTFEGCRGDKKLLRFDFYLDEMNILIEFQGEQHYKPIEVFGGVKGFKKQQKSDKIKREWAEKNHIRLLEIKYDEYNKIEEIIESLN